MPHVSEIPNELLLSIFDLVQTGDSIASLTSLSQVSRRFHLLITPFIYDTFTYNRQSPPHKLRLFLRTLILNSNLRALVRRVNFLDLLAHSWKNHDYYYTRQCPEKDLFIESGIRSRLAIAHNAEWRARIAQNDVTATIMLLFSNLPNVQEVTLDPAHFRNMYIGPLSWNYVVPSPEQSDVKEESTPLAKVERIHLDGRGDHMWAAYFVPFLLLRHLDTLEFTNLELEPIATGMSSLSLQEQLAAIIRMNLEIPFSNVSELSLQGCVIKEQTLAELLSMFATLKTFKFGCTDNFQPMRHISLENFPRCLGQHRNSLKEISINYLRYKSFLPYDKWTDAPTDRPWNKNPYEEFNTFQKLQVLEVEQTTRLWERKAVIIQNSKDLISMLPECLRRLRVTKVEPGELLAFEGAAQEIRFRCANFRNLELVLTEDPHASAKMSLNELKNEYRTAGIILEWKVWPWAKMNVFVP